MMKKVNFFIKKHKWWLVFCFISVSGIFFRFYRIGETFNFFFDVARDFDKVWEMIYYKKLTLLGPQTSFGQWSERETYLGPLYYYLIAIPLYLFKFDALTVILMTGLTNYFSAVILMLIIKSFTKKINLSLMILAIFLLSPFSVFYSRFPWNLNFLPLFVSLCYLFLWKYFRTSGKIFILLSAFFSGLCFELHYIACPLFVVVLAGAIFHKNHKSERIASFIVSVFGFALGIIPMIIFELRHSFFISKAFIFHLFSPQAAAKAQFPSSIAGYFIALPNRFLGFSDYSFVPKNFQFNILSIIFAVTIYLLFITYLFKLKKKDKYYLFYVLCLFNIGFGILFAGFWTINVGMRIEDRYFISLHIPFMIAFITSIRFVLNKKLVGFAIMGLLIIISAYKSTLMINQNIGIDETCVNYGAAKKIAQIITDDVNMAGINNKFNIANMIDSNSRATYYRYFLHINSIFPLSVDQYPQAQFLYVVTRDDVKKVINSGRWEISSSGQKKVINVFNAPYNIKIVKLQKIIK